MPTGVPLLGTTAGLQLAATFQLPVPPTQVATACAALAGRGNSKPNAIATSTSPNTPPMERFADTTMVPPPQAGEERPEPDFSPTYPPSGYRVRGPRSMVPGAAMDGRHPG